jgi:uncharacterized cupin superfamily protein
VANLFEPDFDVEQDRAPYTWRRARLGRQVGAQKLGASLYELEPGASTFPLHVHHHNEELVVVVDGQPTLTTLDGERELEPGDVVSCLPGRVGAHRLDNRSNAPARVLIVSTMLAPEINEFPEDGRLWARSWVPGTDPGEGDVEFETRP